MRQRGTDVSNGAESSDTVRVGLVSGFLGAGKTTAIQRLGTELADRGYTVGTITNDQASGLVDTSLLDRTAGTVVEIPGGCFCCNFPELLAAARSIKAEDVDVLLAEPVGSCTDLVATVVNPLAEIHGEEFSVAPLTTVLDPERVRAYLDEESRLPDEVRYIFRLQVEEADLLVLNKSDTLSEAETDRLVGELERRVGDRPVVPVSAAEGEHIEGWLSAIFPAVETGETLDIDGTLRAEGRALTDIDYDTYAEGEAKLGWVNATVEIAGPFDGTAFRRALMDGVRSALRDRAIEVAHLKFLLESGDELAHANLTSTEREPRYGGVDLGTVETAQLVFNARAVGDPAEIRTVAEETIRETAASFDAAAAVEELQAFRPEYPEPVHRMDGDSDRQSTAAGAGSDT